MTRKSRRRAVFQFENYAIRIDNVSTNSEVLAPVAEYWLNISGWKSPDKVGTAAAVAAGTALSTLLQFSFSANVLIAVRGKHGNLEVEATSYRTQSINLLEMLMPSLPTTGSAMAVQLRTTTLYVERFGPPLVHGCDMPTMSGTLLAVAHCLMSMVPAAATTEISNCPPPQSDERRRRPGTKVRWNSAVNNLCVAT
jgi:hypothetical protein